MELKNKGLEQWLDNSPDGFIMINGEKNRLFHLYSVLKMHLLPLQKEVTTGALISQFEAQSNGELAKNKVMWLNDHGPNHINTVIDRASRLIDGSKVVLTPLEVYMLLCAIQLHDIGNFTGRDKHESKIIQVLGDKAKLVGMDAIQQKYIVQIAKAHGGTVKENKYEQGALDTIEALETVTNLNAGPVRLRLLASILRFADELADDKQRADSNLLISKRLPRGSEIYHAYAYCVEALSFKPHSSAIEISYYVSEPFLNRKFGKGEKNIFLMDELYERIVKVHKERVYCSRHWEGEIDYKRIEVKITFLSEFDNQVSKFDPVTMTISENGYPIEQMNIGSLCLPKQNIKNGKAYFNELQKSSRGN